ncbi:uncharacterized protein [Argopecten irradians]|uniref:uncharacterized protein n=1 Tax=Argopecten irradians TaxID=31199 RepID=UPI003711D955
MKVCVLILILAATTGKEMACLATTVTYDTTTVPGSPTGSVSDKPDTTPGGCVDVFHNCEALGNASCDADHQTWAKKYCAKYCNLCDDQCVDVESNCESYGLAVCQSSFSSWASKNCARFCGICGDGIPTPPVPILPSKAGCHDTIDCSAYSKDVCTRYEIWARQHCASFCGRCG